MKNNAFYLACCFVFMWTLGDVFSAPLQQRLVQALSMTIAYAIYLGVHLMLWRRFKMLLKK